MNKELEININDLRDLRFDPSYLNKISKILNEEYINDLIELKKFSDSIFNYLKEKSLLSDYLSWKIRGLKDGSIKSE